MARPEIATHRAAGGLADPVRYRPRPKPVRAFFSSRLCMAVQQHQPWRTQRSGDNRRTSVRFRGRSASDPRQHARRQFRRPAGAADQTDHRQHSGANHTGERCRAGMRVFLSAGCCHRNFRRRNRFAGSGSNPAGKWPLLLSPWSKRAADCSRQ
ncbi:Hypothetical protein GbCGDNIH8_8717 [Granulibacter bethesdensis]|nr:Hypothetical protein GbCGDNIH8_8717 [Granulibacter bethesdensis]